MRESFRAYSLMKLCFFKVAKSEACIRPLHANPATYSELRLEVLTAGYSSQLSAEHMVYDSQGANGISERGIPNNGEGRA